MVTADKLNIADTPVDDSIEDIVAVLRRLPTADIERIKDTVLKLREACSDRMKCCPCCGGKNIARNGHKHSK